MSIYLRFRIKSLEAVATLCFALAFAPVMAAEVLPSEIASEFGSPADMTVTISMSERAAAEKCSKELVSRNIKFAIIVFTGDRNTSPSWTFTVSKELHPPFVEGDKLLRELNASSCGTSSSVAWTVSQHSHASVASLKLARG